MGMFSNDNTKLYRVLFECKTLFISDCDPPLGWHPPPKPCSIGHDGKGIDCSNFTSFVYNQGLGLIFSSDIHMQADMDSVKINGSGANMTITVIPHQESAAGWKKVLKPGDLIFIRPKGGSEISHVIMWIGEWGIAPAGHHLSWTAMAPIPVMRTEP